MTNNELLQSLGALPDDWHGAGMLHLNVLARMLFHVGNTPLERTAETGTGKSTLLLSRISRHHTVFALNDGDSLSAVHSSALFNASTVEFIEGPTQQTLAGYPFVDKFQLVLIDGPHGYPFPDLEYWYFYPHIAEGGLLIIDDIHIPTIHNLYLFLRDEQMFSFVECVSTTAFFRRTAQPLFDPYGDGWWLQMYNNKRFPALYLEKLKQLVPLALQKKLLKLVGRK